MDLLEDLHMAGDRRALQSGQPRQRVVDPPVAGRPGTAAGTAVRAVVGSVRSRRLRRLPRDLVGYHVHLPEGPIAPRESLRAQSERYRPFTTSLSTERGTA
ncbi:hypothetical protein GCM10023085_69410 [Actinomadura viridis]|uniref:Uncharacterized protein n=1 Tax=Actinomadura viridis TaxID=58110 RepID=A0A931GP41_9ACTN|nr:hypothetical protein [Actinomadura viridis]MBG6090201.1 hypothetical protein [Actinomadura viridis]